MNDRETNETRVDILNSATGEIVGHCDGPTPTGACPYAEPDGTVPCHGSRIAPMSAGAEYWHILVPPESRHCPQAWNLGAVTY